MKIYIVCPYNKSGGPRSLHQLGNSLVERGFDVYMYYGHRGEVYKTTKLLYSDSKAKIANDIEDRENNVLITPESDTGWMLDYHNIKKVVWWLSLNFYLDNNIWWRSKHRTFFLHQPYFFTYLTYIYLKLTKPHINYVFPSDLVNIDYHLYNCEYVHEYLLKHNIKESKMNYLCGPIDIKRNNEKEFISKKENLILYNPAKASPYMLKRVLWYMNKNYPNYKLKALQNLAHEKVLEYLKKAKVYLDLGYFPGPERMPREASMSYCNIITSTIGAASNKQDVPIPSKFKFDLNKQNVPQICKLIVDMCDNYTSYTHYYDVYRKKTLSQIDNFNSDIERFIHSINGFDK